MKKFWKLLFFFIRCTNVSFSLQETLFYPSAVSLRTEGELIQIMPFAAQPPKISQAAAATAATEMLANIVRFQFRSNHSSVQKHSSIQSFFVVVVAVVESNRRRPRVLVDRCLLKTGKSSWSRSLGSARPSLVKCWERCERKKRSQN